MSAHERTSPMLHSRVHLSNHHLSGGASNGRVHTQAAHRLQPPEQWQQIRKGPSRASRTRPSVKVVSMATHPQLRRLGEGGHRRWRAASQCRRHRSMQATEHMDKGRSRGTSRVLGKNAQREGPWRTTGAPMYKSAWSNHGSKTWMWGGGRGMRVLLPPGNGSAEDGSPSRSWTMSRQAFSHGAETPHGSAELAAGSTQTSSPWWCAARGPVGVTAAATAHTYTPRGTARAWNVHHTHTKATHARAQPHANAIMHTCKS
jgi:hypothetical protein